MVEMLYFVRFISAGGAKTDNGRGGKLNSHLMAMSCIKKYSYQNLLQLNHFSSSYDDKNCGVFLCHTVYIES